ncbi:MAG TPA: hypothetical protein VFA09_06625 [Ktedonobacteraceae bacterium]|nr:hypothetical protein [Ktedonobacteraceae bacterium]
MNRLPRLCRRGRLIAPTADSSACCALLEYFVELLNRPSVPTVVEASKQKGKCIHGETLYV